MHILVLNVGSSSIKAALFKKGEEGLETRWKGTLARRKENVFILKLTQEGGSHEEPIELSSLYEGVKPLLENLWAGKSPLLHHPAEISRVGHRIVHGGEKLLKPTVITAEVKKEIESLCSIAPLHNPPGLQGIEAAQKLFPTSLHIAVFDTSFHQTMSEAVYTYPGPYEWREQGIRRYGFHGISHGYCAAKAREMLHPFPAEKMICCHLGNGCSVTAIHQGRSVVNSMGFTPLEGLMMGSRSGSVDPAILLHLLRYNKASIDSLDHLLNYDSGLKGISGESGDMQWIVQQNDAGHSRAKLAFEMFIYHLKFYIGAFTTILEGLDALVFTGGIGENAIRVREETCKGLAFLGIHLDQKANHNCIPNQDVAKKDSPVRILVIHTQEELAIAEACLSMES
ncbi:acetate kinase [Parachlamydia sp. AcF125]|uniref:acetate/propionate family kinase n=1 Tax=Parachlamydia sp. AcF125 TaxID=2795736 RepID=UPI001BC9A17B|nr:acetate kinase [Parachlamydia sp. AcF125]MBS4168901.1 Acetate kinase [Parachlamydia sp. AcF125]